MIQIVYSTLNFYTKSSSSLEQSRTSAISMASGTCVSTLLLLLSTDTQDVKCGASTKIPHN